MPLEFVSSKKDDGRSQPERRKVGSRVKPHKPSGPGPGGSFLFDLSGLLVGETKGNRSRAGPWGPCQDTPWKNRDAWTPLSKEVGGHKFPCS